MERVLTAEQMRNADEYTIKKLGVPEEVLVERAGTALYEEIIARYKGGRVLVAVGKGNNGKDGKIIAEKLALKHGFSVTLFDAFSDELSLLDREYDLIVDCIFGTGLNKDITGRVAEVIKKINKNKAKVIACDIATGLDANTGLAYNVCVKADLTVAVQEFKTGHFLNDGKEYSGEVVAKDIGISIWENRFTFKLRSKDVKAFYVKRNENTNKGSYGKAGVIGGSKDFFGAPLLSKSALSTMLSGAGYGYLFVPSELYSIYAGLDPECIISTVKSVDGNMTEDGELLDKIKGLDAVAFGMGAGATKGTYDLLLSILKNYDKKLIIDADGLNALAKFGVDALKDKKCEVLITPHVKEFSRLSGKSVQEIILNPIAVAEEFANEYGVTVLLKGTASIITDGERTCMNITGTPALAKAGSGDVLSGVIAGLSATNPLYNSACIGAYTFGIAGELCAKEHSEYSVVASKLPEYLGKAIVHIQNK